MDHCHLCCCIAQQATTGTTENWLIVGQEVEGNQLIAQGPDKEHHKEELSDEQEEELEKKDKEISELQKEMRDVYPNPAIKGNRIKINVDGNSYLSKIILTDINGIIIDQQSISNTEFFEYYIPYNISNGVYFLNIFSANNYETIKIIVE